MQTGDIVVFKKDGLFGKGIVIDRDSHDDEYDRFVSVTEIYSQSKHCEATIGDVWGICEVDLSEDCRAMWRKPYQVSVDGYYAMTRTDDSTKAQVIVHVLNGRFAEEPELPIRDFDIECRFYGPILSA